MLRDIVSIVGAVISFLGFVVSVATLLAICVTATVYYFQLKEMRKSTVASKKSADAAETAVKQAEANLHLDQRAWIAIGTITGFPESGKPFRPKVTVINTGRTFAKNLDVVGTSDAFDRGKVPDFATAVRQSAERRNPEGISHALVPPNGSTELPMEPRTEGVQMTDDYIKTMKNGDIRVFMFGQLTYDDIFGHHHWLTFCVTLDYNPRQPENSGWNYMTYKQYNDTGDGQPPWKY